MPYELNYIMESKTSGEIRNSNKTNRVLINEKEHSLKFLLTDLIAIRKFAEITGIEIDETKFSNRREK